MLIISSIKVLTLHLLQKLQKGVKKQTYHLPFGSFLHGINKTVIAALLMLVMLFTRRNEASCYHRWLQRCYHLN